LLEYARYISDNLVPYEWPLFKDAFPGLLLDDTTPWQSDTYARPFSLMWLYDSAAKERRNQMQDLPANLREMPLLPHFTFTARGDGDCLLRAMQLGDVRTAPADASAAAAAAPAAAAAAVDGSAAAPGSAVGSTSGPQEEARRLGERASALPRHPLLGCVSSDSTTEEEILIAQHRTL
jgi:hypothetical protein